MVHTVEIPRSQWPGYFDAVSKAMENAQLSIEVAPDRSVPEVQANRLALQFVAYDRRDELFEVAGESESSRPISVYHHLVESPERIAVDSATTTPSRIEVVERDGQRTVIKLERTDIS
jgi:hypothetical protein